VRKLGFGASARLLEPKGGRKTMADYKTQLYDKAEGVATITFNRPEKSNCMDTLSFNELLDALEDAHHDQDVRVIVIAAKGNAWCSGRDIYFTRHASREENQAYRAVNTQTGTYLRSIPKPVISRIQGHVAGGGGRMAFSDCDISIAADDLQFARREINTGVITNPFDHIFQIGRNRAMGWLLTGRFISAKEAHDWGLLTEVVPRDQLDRVVQEYVDMLLPIPPRALATLKRGVNMAMDMAGRLLHQSTYGEMSAYVWESEDRSRLEDAFLSKTWPYYAGKKPKVSG
jgi:enoyl-CoA hydratase/carnithine racemase